MLHNAQKAVLTWVGCATQEQLRGLRSGGMPAVTHLKYAVEVQIPRGTPMLGLLEPLLERVVFEDVPCNLAALKQRVETLCLNRRIDRLESAGARCSWQENRHFA